MKYEILTFIVFPGLFLLVCRRACRNAQRDATPETGRFSLKVGAVTCYATLWSLGIFMASIVLFWFVIHGLVPNVMIVVLAIYAVLATQFIRQQLPDARRLWNRATAPVADRTEWKPS